MLNDITHCNSEYSVIGALCHEPKCIEQIVGRVSGDDFEVAACAEVFETAYDAYTRGKAFDYVIAADCLKKIMPSAEAERFVIEAMQVMPTAANVVEYADLIRRNAGHRKLHAAVLEALTGNNPQEIASEFINISQSFLASENPARLTTLQGAIEAMYRNQDRSSLRLDTGFPKLDGILKGIWGGNFVIIGARPGVGKSAFALDIARTAAQRGNKVLIYSLEMLADELAERLISRNSGIELDRLIDNNLDDEAWQAIGRTSSALSKLPIFINDDPSTTVAKIRSQARTLKNLKLIIVDFITLMQPDKRYDNRNLEVGAISRALKVLASELQIPVIALAQLNRGTDDTDQPTLRSLRDSGELEQNANKVLLLWHTDKELSDIGVSVAKNRRGRTGVVKMHFDGAHMKYTELSEDYVPPTKKKRRVFDDE